MAKKQELTYCTVVPRAALKQAIQLWLRTSTVRAHVVDGVRQDLYLKIVAVATQLPYYTVLDRFEAGDEGLQRALHEAKLVVFANLMTAPASVLVFHDEVLVHEAPKVESKE
jgi:hypothetical protein